MLKTIPQKEVKLFGEILNSKGKKILFYHNDPDGISSAVMILRFFPDFRAIPRKGPIMDSAFVKEIIKEAPDVIVWLDMPVDQEYAKLKAIREKLPHSHIAVLDHHIIERDLKSLGVLHINPRFDEKKAYLPSAYLVYKMLEELGFDVKPMIWIACIGMIGDYGIFDTKDVLDECRSEYPYLLKGNPMKSRLAEASKMVSSAVTVKGLKGAGEALKALKTSHYYEDLIGIKKLKAWKELVDEEVKEQIVRFDKSKEKVGDAIFFKIESRFNVSSVVSTILSEKNPDVIIAVRKKFKDGWKISFRNQSGKYNLGKIIKKAVKGLGSGGGHEKAGAAVVKKWVVFKKAFLKEVKKKV